MPGEVEWSVSWLKIIFEKRVILPSGNKWSGTHCISHTKTYTNVGDPNCDSITWRVILPGVIELLKALLVKVAGHLACSSVLCHHATTVPTSFFWQFRQGKGVHRAPAWKKRMSTTQNNEWEQLLSYQVTVTSMGSNWIDWILSICKWELV